GGGGREGGGRRVGRREGGGGRRRGPERESLRSRNRIAARLLQGTHGRRLCRGVFSGRRAPGDRGIRRPGQTLSHEGLRTGKELRSGTARRRCTVRWRVLLFIVSRLIA